MRIFVVGDLHLKKKFVYRSMLDELLNLSLELKPDLIVHLGDTLDTKSNIDMGCLKDACNFFIESSEIAPTYVLIGNHDRRNDSDFLSDFHPFVGMENIPNLHIVHKVVFRKNEDGSTFTFVPYVPVGRFRDALLTADIDLTDPSEDYPKENVPDLIFAHQQFKNSVPMNKKGDEWDETLPYVISGHIHGHLRLPGVLYTGSPVQHKFGESEDKSVWLIETEDGKVTKETRIRLKNVIPKRDVAVAYEDINNINMNMVSDPNFQTRVIFEVDESKTKALKSSVTFSELSKLRNVTVHIKVLGKEPIDDEDVELLSMDELIRKHLKDDTRALELYEMFKN